MGKGVDEANTLRKRAMDGEVAPDKVRGVQPGPNETYLGGAAFGTMNMKERVQLLDREGMAKAVLYPTLGLLWEAELFDAELSSAYCRAYNRWIADFCRDSGGRLIPIAHLSLGDPGEARASSSVRWGTGAAARLSARSPSRGYRTAIHGTMRSSRPLRISTCLWRSIPPSSRSPSTCTIAS